MNKQEILDLISSEIDKIPNKEKDNFSFYLNLCNYAPSGDIYDSIEKTIQFETYDVSKVSIIDEYKKKYILDTLGTKFKCEMGYSDCEQRGFCNGDC